MAGANAKAGIRLSDAVFVSQERVSILTGDQKPLGDLAWDYFFSTPASKGMHRDPKDPYALNHAFAGLVKGMEENYAWMGQHWPGSRYIVISLSFEGCSSPSF